MINEKKVSKSGSITIPSYLRREMGLEAGEKVKIEQDGNGNFFIQRIEGSCIFCGTNEGLKKVKGKFVCKDCVEAVLESEEGIEKKGENGSEE